MLPVIEVKNLSKKYKIGIRQPYITLRDTIMDTLKKPSTLLSKFTRKKETHLEKGEFWALKDINFAVEQGEVVGVIGRNGAGKSTLLKILSHITPPTTGEIRLRGRISSLLEAGTGFNPELTGRENVFLNGIILGMSISEIKRKFKKIVEFSEIEKFIDTPVKYYSSGMRMRLAFSVAAFREPEILIIDEVLAVGDLPFKLKCLKKMQDVAKQGTTVLLVSHSMSIVNALVSRVILLEKGKIQKITSVDNAIRKYLYDEDALTPKNPGKIVIEADISDKKAYIIEGRILNKDGKSASKFVVSEPIFIEIKWVNKGGVPINPNFMLTNREGVNVMIALDVTSDWYGTKKKKKGTYVSRVEIPANLLNASEYSVSLALDCSDPVVCFDNRTNALNFLVWDPLDKKSIARGAYIHDRSDVSIWPALKWTWTKVNRSRA